MGRILVAPQCCPKFVARHGSPKFVTSMGDKICGFIGLSKICAPHLFTKFLTPPGVYKMRDTTGMCKMCAPRGVQIMWHQIFKNLLPFPAVSKIYGPPHWFPKCVLQPSVVQNLCDPGGPNLVAPYGYPKCVPQRGLQNHWCLNG
jgi:hypothetical protein